MQRINPRIMRNISAFSQMKMSSDSGSRSGKGSAGAIREAGGAFAQMEAAHENQYFYNQQKEQLRKLKEGLTDEIAFHEEQIRRHQEAIERHKTRMDDMPKSNDK
ncbi:hypothetical protein M0802_006585 [Mischocyttarus mexicanus]|nr:hypothetical protein M0802_006585 [Mischocyttarus mexicanus]